MKKVGIVGGGQLGKMMISSSAALDLDITVLDPSPDCPAHRLANRTIQADFHDKEAIRKLASCVDVLTFEFEHIDVTALEEAEREGCLVVPSAETLRLIQDKGVQKQHLRDSGLPVPDFRFLESEEEALLMFQEKGPLMLKSRRGGYDGKGSLPGRTEEEVRTAWRELEGRDGGIFAEVLVPFEKEISVLSCRGLDGKVSLFPIMENRHKNSILDLTFTPAQIEEATAREALRIAEGASHAVSSVGMLCTELFVLSDGSVFINELAPRPHNSGHLTIEACETDQFEAHMRAILNLPQGSTRLLRPAAMKNLLGAKSGVYEPPIEKALLFPEVKVHIYGKKDEKAFRKMGHLTALAESSGEAVSLVERAYRSLTEEAPEGRS